MFAFSISQSKHKNGNKYYLSSMLPRCNLLSKTRSIAAVEISSRLPTGFFFSFLLQERKVDRVLIFSFQMTGFGPPIKKPSELVPNEVFVRKAIGYGASFLQLGQKSKKKNFNLGAII